MRNLRGRRRNSGSSENSSPSSEAQNQARSKLAPVRRSQRLVLVPLSPDITSNGGGEETSKRGRKRKRSNPTTEAFSTPKKASRKSSNNKENISPAKVHGSKQNQTHYPTVFVKLEKEEEVSKKVVKHTACFETPNIPQEELQCGKTKNKLRRGNLHKSKKLKEVNVKIEPVEEEETQELYFSPEQTTSQVEQNTTEQALEHSKETPVQVTPQTVECPGPKKRGRKPGTKTNKNSQTAQFENQSKSPEFVEQVKETSATLSKKFQVQAEKPFFLGNIQINLPSIQWTNEKTTGEPVLWGTQGINSLTKLTNLKIFVIGSSAGENLEVVKTKKPRTTKARGSGQPRFQKSRLQQIKQEIVEQNLSQCSNSMGDALDQPTTNTVGNNSESLVQDNTQLESFSVPIQENGELIIDDNVAHFENVQSSPVTYKVLRGGRRKKRFSEPEFHPVAPGHKPNNTYTEIIARALAENPKGLTVSEIYDWISQTYSYYLITDERWKNSVRHNLSISPYFRKGGKADGKAGHVWTIAEQCKQDVDENTVAKRKSGVSTRSRKADSNASMDLSNVKSEAELAVLVNVQKILGNYKREAGDADTDNGNQDVAADSSKNQQLENEVWKAVERAEEAAAVDKVLASFDAPDGKDGEVLQIDMQDLHIEPSNLLTSYYSNQQVIFSTTSHSQPINVAETNTFVAAMDENHTLLTGPTAERVFEYVYNGSTPFEEDELDTHTLGEKSTQEQVDMVMEALHGTTGSSSLVRKDTQDLEKTQLLNELNTTQQVIELPSEEETQPLDDPMETMYDEEGQPLLFH